MTPSFRALRLVARAVLAVGLLACSESPTESTSAVDVTLTADRTLARPSAPVQFTITITNRSLQPRIVDAVDGYACPAFYEVRDKDQQLLELPGRYCALVSLAPRTLAPGESMVLHDSWSGERTDSAHGTVPTAAGTYSVSAKVNARGSLLISSPVQITVPPQ